LANETVWELERRYDQELWTVYDTLWGAPAIEEDSTADPPIAARAEIIGAESQMRTADQEFNDANIRMS